MALAGPTIVAMRALARVTTGISGITTFLIDWATVVGATFRKLFNQPESMALVRGLWPKLPYWKAVLQYAVNGNLQSVLDEYVHVLHESVTSQEKDLQAQTLDIALAMIQGMSLRTAALSVDELLVDANEIKF